MVRCQIESYLELPLCPDGIPCDMRVRRKNDETVGNRLTDEKPVKRVLVVFRQPGKLEHRRFIKRQGINEVEAAPFFDKFMGRFRQRQFTEVVLDDDLPGGSNAQVDLIVRVCV